MGKSFLRLMIVLCFLILSIVLLVNAVNDLQCEIISGGSCTDARLLGIENDTGGFVNAHVQNNTYSNYAYSLCCNNSNSSITVSAGCPGNATVLKLSNATNAHVEIGSNSNYSIPVCLSTDWKRITCSYVGGSCPAPSVCILSMANSEGANTSNAHVGNCSSYYQKVCCKLENKAPTPPPTLYYPANGNTSVFERRPNFNWSSTTDPDGDVVDYTLNVTCGSTCPAACTDVDVDSLSITNYTLSSPLCVDQSYNWTVSACDPYEACNTSLIWNFTIQSVADLEMLVNGTSFGSMNNGETNDTTDESPPPFVARNIGNVLLNVTINASALFDSVAMNTVYFQFSADENETDFTTYDRTCSQHGSFANMTTTSKNIFCNITYEEDMDEGEIEFNITIPLNEGADDKSSIIEIGYYSTE